MQSAGVFARAKPLFWHYPHKWYRDVGLGIEPFSAMRRDRYKVIYFHGDGIADGAGEDPRLEVYDLSNDLSEEHNLVDARPKLSAGLSDELFRWLRQVGAGIPIVKATDEPGA